jgi:hypothetical protein
VILLGIDPGTAVGLAQWSTTGQVLGVVTSMSALAAMDWIRTLPQAQHPGSGELLIVLEDARKSRIHGGPTFGKANRLQGVGSVKRDSALWVEFCTRERIPFVTIKPRRRATKKNAALFRQITGWQGRTNEHGRDAAMFVWGTSATEAQLLLARARLAAEEQAAPKRARAAA